MNRRTAPVVVALVTALLTVACNQQQASEQEPPTPTPIPTPIVPTKPTYTVKRGEVVRQVQFTGRVGPVKEVELFFKVSGRVRNVNVERDQEVKKDELLADMEIEPLERQVAQSELDLERVQTQLDRAQKTQEASIVRAQVELSMRTLELQRLQGQDLDSKRIQAEAAFEAARLNLARAQSDYDNAPPEGRSGSPQAMNLERVTLDYQTAKAAYDLAMAEIITGHEYDVAMATRQVTLAANNVESLKQGVDPLLVNDVKRAELALKT
ncbi:MAG: biotin/lipoyl-binding protein, partial [Chloroflexi bacterium]|nr:biotin/lipoyl-binding protein [Chloroflexota bacterium]